jgi:peptide/nickel transport system substrate-binding protein
MLERLSPTNLDEAKHDPNLVVQSAVGVGHQSIRFNIAHGPLANTAFAKSKLVRQAFSWSIDRKALNQVVFGGAYAPGNQPFPPNSPWYDKDFPVPDRDIDKAKALMKQAGFDHVDATMSIPNDPQGLQAGQVLQSMAAEAGINLKLQATEYATLLSMNTSGNYQISYIAWSGRADPDGNTYSFMVCGGDLNDGGYCNPEMDKLLNAARASTDEATRKKDYDAAEAIIQDDEPLLYVFHQTWIWAMRKNVTGFVPSPDGMIRLVGMKKG